MGIQQSTITFSQAKQRVIDAAGAAGTAETTRAGYAIQAAIQDWNNDEAWNFLRKVSAALTITSGVATLPTDFKYIYSVIFDGAPMAPLDQKLADYTLTGVPTFYNLFQGGLAGAYVIGIIPSPSNGSTIILNYNRAIVVPSDDTDILDIPQDYENYLLAQSKYLYLLDKGPQYTAQLGGWKNFFEEGKRKAIAAETRRPTENKMFIPEGSIGMNSAGFFNVPDLVYGAE